MGMIRPAKSIDAFALVDILKERYPEMRYAGQVAIDEVAARRLFAQAVQRHGGTTEGATFLMVSEREGVIDAFMLGMLSRVYMIGDMLSASDVFLIGKRGCDPRAVTGLIDRYLEWADGNPRVYEVGLSHADTIPGSERIIDVFKRRGLTLCATTYRRDRIPQEMAA